MNPPIPGLRVSWHQDRLVYSLNGRPLMETGPIKLEVIRDGETITVRASQDVRTFEQSPKPS